MNCITLHHDIALPVIKEIRTQINPQGVPKITSAYKDITPRHTARPVMPPLPLLLSGIAVAGERLHSRSMPAEQ